MALIAFFIAWLASLVGVVGITPYTAGWIGCALVCGATGVMLWGSTTLVGSFDEFTWYLFFPGVAGTIFSAGLLVLAIVVPFWRGLGIHEIVVR